ncbi:MAG: hypothetical protein ACPGUV_15055 [Polyangiales bacterium]
MKSSQRTLWTVLGVLVLAAASGAWWLYRGHGDVPANNPRSAAARA